MASSFRREEALRRASGLLDAGYDGDYIQQKLVKEGFTAEEAAKMLQTLIDSPMVKPIVLSPEPVNQAQPESESVNSNLSNQTQHERAAAIQRAKQILGGNFDEPYARGKLIHAGFTGQQANELIEELKKRRAKYYSGGENAYTPSPYSEMYPEPASNNKAQDIVLGLSIMFVGCAFSYMLVVAARNGASFVIIPTGIIIFGGRLAFRALMRD